MPVFRTPPRPGGLDPRPIAFLAGCGSSGDDEAGDPAGQATSGASGKSGSTEQVKVFLTEGEQFDPVERQVPPDSDVPLAATRELLEGPNEGDAATASMDAVQTAIPPNVEVKDLKVDDSGEAVVELSDEFLGDIPAEPAKQHRPSERSGRGHVPPRSPTRSPSSRRSRRSGSSQRRDLGHLPMTTGPTSAEPAKKPKPPGRAASTGRGRRALPRTASSRSWLISATLPPSGVDGIVGYQTQQAVIAFQAWEGLTRDGVAGPARPTPR